MAAKLTGSIYVNRKGNAQLGIQLPLDQAQDFRDSLTGDQRDAFDAMLVKAVEGARSRGMDIEVGTPKPKRPAAPAAKPATKSRKASTPAPAPAPAHKPAPKETTNYRSIKVRADANGYTVAQQKAVDERMAKMRAAKVAKASARTQVFEPTYTAPASQPTRGRGRRATKRAASSGAITVKVGGKTLIA